MRAWGRTGIAAGLVLAMAWCAPAAAQTACPAGNRFTIDWDSYPDTVVGTASSSYSNTNGAGVTRTVTVTWSGDLGDITAAPRIAQGNFGGPTATKTLWWGQDVAARTANIAGNIDVVAVTLTFDQPVRDVQLALFDVDYRPAAFRDWVRVVGRNGAATYTPLLTTPHGNGNAGPPTNASSSITVGPATSGVSIPATDAVGNSLNDTAENRGNLNIGFAQPVTSIEIRYANGPTGWAPVEAQTAYQVLNIHDIRFCPMPNLAIAKSSAPVATTGINSFNVPAAAIDYTLTVSNTGGSTIDIGSTALADILPTNVTFFNGDIDAATAGTQNFVFTPGTSGLTLAAANLAYSNNNGASYAYTPVAGYDGAVDAVRFAPQGAMAANSSFTIRFRARIN